MVLVYFYAKRSNYRDFKHLRDTSELLKGSRFPDGGNPPSVLDSLRKNAFKVTRHFHREQIALRGLQDKLASAQSAGECWAIIRETYEEFGFLGVELYLCGRHYGELPEDLDQAKCWTMWVPLSDSDYVKLTRDFEPTRQHMVVGPFVDLLKTAIEPKLLGFESELAAVPSGKVVNGNYATAVGAGGD